MNSYVLLYRKTDADEWEVFSSQMKGTPILFFDERVAINFALDSPDERLRHQFRVERAKEIQDCYPV